MAPENWSSHEDGNCFIISGHDWPKTIPKRVFVQSCYPELLDVCQTNFDSGIQGIFILGTPGIGKSCFLDYALHRYLQDNKSVLYLRGPLKMAFVLQSSGSVDTYELEDGLRQGLARNVDVILYDPHEDPMTTNDVNRSLLME